jgi:hypothetical protein
MTHEPVAASSPGAPGPFESEGDDTAAHLLDVALGRAEPRAFWTDLRGPLDDPPRQRLRVTIGRSKRWLGGMLVVLIAIGTYSQARREPGRPAVGIAGSSAASPPPNSETTASPRSTSPLGFELPEGWLDRCRPSPSLDRAAAASLVCELEPGPMRVELRRIDDDAIRSARFVELASRSPSGSGASRCARGRPEVRSWSRPEAPNLVAGSYGCSSRDDRAEVVWTDDVIDLLGRAVGRDDDLGAMYRWWTTEAPGAPTN